jgi:splicing factor 3B subunit 4
MTTAGFSSFMIGSTSYALPGVVERNQDATLYVGNLDSKVDEELLWELFVQCGPLASVSLPRDRVTGCHQGFAFVEYKTTDDADYAVKILNMVRLWGKPIRCNKSASVDKGSRGPEQGANVFVGGLSPEIDEPYLADTFSAFGPVMFAKIMRDPETAASKGFGFVTFDSFSSADAAISAMNGQYLGNKVISVTYAQKKEGKEAHGTAAERLMADLRKKQTAAVASTGMSIPPPPPSGGMGYMIPPPPPPPPGLGMYSPPPPPR